MSVIFVKDDIAFDLPRFIINMDKKTFVQMKLSRYTPTLTTSYLDYESYARIKNVFTSLI